MPSLLGPGDLPTTVHADEVQLLRRHAAQTAQQQRGRTADDRKDGQRNQHLKCAETQTAIQAGTAAAQAESAATRNELRRMQLSNELTSVEYQLATVQSDIRAAMRMPRNRVISQQLRQLQGQEAALLRRRADIDAILNPRRPPSLPVSRPGSSRGCVGWAFLLLAWFCFWPIMLPWTLIRSESRAMQIAGYAIAALFVFWILMGVIAGQ